MMSTLEDNPQSPQQDDADNPMPADPAPGMPDDEGSSNRPPTDNPTPPGKLKEAIEKFGAKPRWGYYLAGAIALLVFSVMVYIFLGWFLIYFLPTFFGGICGAL